MSVTAGHDAIHANIGHLPPGQAAGYTTGTDGSNGTVDIRWRTGDWPAHPGAVRICQDAGGSDSTADVFDVERGAGTNDHAAAWFKRAQVAYHTAARPGQRSPAVYTSASNVTPLVNALIAGGVKSGCGLWVANWNLSPGQAANDVSGSAGPFPVIAVQYSNGQFYDSDVFSSAWLGAVSKAGPPPPHRHLTAAGDTVHSIAVARRMKVEDWLSFQRKTGADVAALSSGPLPAGLEWHSVNP